MSAPNRVALGICLGATSVGLVHLSLENGRAAVLREESRAHGGDPSGTMLAMLDAVPGWRGLPLCVTGRKLRHTVTVPAISEPEAVELAVRHEIGPLSGPLAVVSAGGETFMAYGLDASGRVRDIRSGNKCASGTGEFLAQQLGRMGLAVADLSRLDAQADPYGVSGRCSVFCKSDCTHALNKGAAKQSVVAGLGRMMAGKCMELLHGLERDAIVLTGGCSANPFLARFLAEQAGEVAVPGSAPWFEALGAALWALDRQPVPLGGGELFRPREPVFAMLPPLSDSLGRVEFKEHPRDSARPGDEVLVGLDVGSTTTKGVVVRRSDKAVLAGEYLRTEGDPVAASRAVYESLSRQLGASSGCVRITGLGVTGSGRAIAALHASATAAINEIVAHAAAAAHYDPAVDTIFEIGGQDAKYTYLSSGHPCDSAMNEACSAGTGSFLEEAARESLGVDTLDIADLALSAKATPDFNDQCAAFIGSDIKLAAQEGLPLPEILAGLVHSVCLNYVSRVKGSRPVGDTVFMQGGVCYNRAVPAAMAMLTGKRIVVPPDPGLMGALGVALEVDRRMGLGLLPEDIFDLDRLAGLSATRREPFTCRGGKGGQPGCDRGCRISRIEVAGKVHPFGGICNRFENLRKGAARDAASLNLAQARQRRVFRDHDGLARTGRPVVGLNRSYLVNTFYPLFAGFFRELGFQVALPDAPDPEGILRMGASLCYPAELSHCFMGTLAAMRPDAVFLPHVKSVLPAGGQDISCTCVLLQGEPFSLAAAFPELRDRGTRLLAPTLDFSRGFAGAEDAFLGVAKSLGADSRAGRRAFQAGLSAQVLCREDLSRMGREALMRLADGEADLGVALFGRAYNAFAPEANKAVPEKLATRGAMVIPCDMLPTGGGRDGFAMYWGQGRTILAGAGFAKDHPSLFGAYLTNFSCGPDSFLLGYFRDVMGEKPSLTLEVDSHTADAGLETRLEAFLDIADSHRRAATASRAAALSASSGSHRRAVMEAARGKPGMRLTSGEWLPLTHPRAKVVIPSMNPWGSALAASGLKSLGIEAEALPPAERPHLLIGRGNSSCKECLPLQLTVGTLLDYLENRPQGEATAYFMPGAKGPCRFGQYAHFSQTLIDKLRIPDAAVLSPSADNGYDGLPAAFTLALWRGIVAGDAFEQMRASLLAAAKDPDEAMALLHAAFGRVATAMSRGWSQALAGMRRSARELARVPLRARLDSLPVVALVGEIYVRHDPISRQKLVRRLASMGFAVRTAPVSEWIFYADWLQNQGITEQSDFKTRIKQWFKKRAHDQVARAFAPSGLLPRHTPDAADLVRAGSRFISPRLTGEAILTVGAAFHEILSPACGVVAIGPFGCMPTRLAESVLKRCFDTNSLGEIAPWKLKGLPEGSRGKLPLLCLETDGNPFPQLIEARLEAFCLQAMRLHDDMAR